MTKTSRQHLIVQLLSEHAVASQQQLVDLLEDSGVTATRATVSRDLEGLGAVKVRVPGGSTVYAIPEHPVDRIAPEEHLRKVMGDWVADIGASGNLAVVRTPPGSAHVVASALDRAGLARDPRNGRRRRLVDRGGHRRHTGLGAGRPPAGPGRPGTVIT